MIRDDVVVVGAGIAGLAAARILVAAGKKVTVVEARDRVGGRTENATFSDGQWIELGGQWIGPTQDRMYELVAELGLETVPMYNTGNVVLRLLGNRTLMGPAKDDVPRLGAFGLVDLGRAMARFNRLAASVELEKPWRSPDSELLDGQTFRTWIDRNLHTAAGRAYFQVFVEAIFAAEPADVSLLHALFYTKSGKDLETLISVEDGAQQDRILGGAARLSERMAEELGDRVVLSSPVRTVRQHDQGVTVISREGVAYEAARAIVTLPPTLAGRLEYEPMLPSWRDQLTQRLPAGSVIKLHLLYDSPFWRRHGLNGQLASDEGPVKITFDNTPPGYARGVMTGFMEGNDGRRWARRSAQDRKAAFVECLMRSFGKEAGHPLEYIERDWMAEEYSRGCYGAHFGPGVWTEYGRALAEPIGRIHWAGAECASVWNGYMEGAIRSASNTAREVAAAL